jgi:hypothetical protein
MAARARRWGDLSKSAQERALRIAKDRYDLTENQVRKRYNRGTYNPYARSDPLLRIPLEFRHEPLYTEQGELTVDWGALAKQNMTRVFGPASRYGERIKWNEFQVEKNIDRASEKVLRLMAQASESELEEIAFIQNPSENVALPGTLKMEDIGYYVGSKKKPGEREWINIFWYH